MSRKDNLDLDRSRDDGPATRSESHHRDRHGRHRQGAHGSRRRARCSRFISRTRCWARWTSGTRASTRIRASRSACAASQVSEQEAEKLTLEFLRQHVDQGASPICGNSICQDRRFLIRHMPELAAFFHYRNLDVSTLKILAKLWLPEVGNRFEKKSVHLALADIHDSIRELRFYREHLFKR